MWFKQAASSVWNATKNILADQRSPAHKLLDQIHESQEEIISTAKLNELATLTYDLQSFQEIVDIVIERIRVFKYDLQEARKNLNMLIVVNYLIKHGATAFVDELREYIPTFKKYQTLQDLKTYQDEEKQNKFGFELEKIKSRANHIQHLLQDKQKLLKQKELSMLIKQKLKLYEKQKMDAFKSTSKAETHNAHQQTMNQKMNKLEWMMENYLWQYVDKVDGKLEEVSEKVMKQVDKYIIGQEIPQKFELEEDEEEDRRNQGENYKPIGQDNDEDLMKRLQAEIQEGGISNQPIQSNLLQFEQVLQQEVNVKKEPQNQTLI